jgi:hypothetical protein
MSFAKSTFQRNKPTMTAARSFVFAGIIIILSACVAHADSFWNHNGSIMRLVANGSQRAFYYELPRNGIQEQGVGHGTLLFDGFREGNHYYGTARRFRSDCEEPLRYNVEGFVNGERQVILTGVYPVYSTGCRATGRYKRDQLVFDYVSDEGIGE